MVLRSKSVACGASCCDRAKAVCADTVCTHELTAWDACIGPGEVNVQGDVNIAQYYVAPSDPNLPPVAKGGNLNVDKDANIGGVTFANGGVIDGYAIKPPENQFTVEFETPADWRTPEVFALTNNALSFAVWPNQQLVAGAHIIKLTFTEWNTYGGDLRTMPTISLNGRKSDTGSPPGPDIIELAVSSSTDNTKDSVPPNVLNIYVTTSTSWADGGKTGFTIHFNKFLDQ